MDKLKLVFKSLANSDGFRRVFHTFWQAAGGILIAQLLAAHNSTDVKAAVVVAAASGLAAVKALWVK